MEQRKLGQTGLNVSLICLGTMTWGRQNDEQDGHRQMDYALSRGVNFFDTAEMYAVPPNAETYGATEKIIGSWFAARKNRDQVVLATKIAGPGLAWVRGGTARIDRANITAAVEGSLHRLQTDYIDLYQLHWPNRGSYHFSQHWGFVPGAINPEAERENFLEVLQICDELIKQGKLRHIGLSNETAWGIMNWLGLAETHNLPRMASVQNEYSLLCRLFEPDLAEIAHCEEIGLLAWSPLATGLLSGKYSGGARPEGSRWHILPTPSARDTPAAHQATEEYCKLAFKYGLDPCQMALAFVNSRPFVTSTIIGATTMAQLESNIDAATLALEPEVLAEIAAIYRRYPRPY